MKKLLSIESNSNRIDWIDLARGFGIILVIWAHAYIPYNSPYSENANLQGLFIYSFHMPLFFFLSGLCFLSRNLKFKDFLCKKIKGLIIPYISFSIIWIIAESMMSFLLDSFSIKYFFENAFLYVSQIRMHAIWYLTCIFILELLYFFISKLEKKAYILVISLLFLTVGIIYNKFVNKNLVWNIDIIPFAIPFFTVGFLMKDYIKKWSFSNNKGIFIFVVLTVLNQGLNIINCRHFGNHYVNMYKNEYGNFLLFYTSAFAGVFAMIVFCKLLENKFAFPSYIGRNSLVFFGLHQILFMIFGKVFDYINVSDIVESACWIGITIVSIVILTIVNEIMNKTKLKIFLGK